MQHVMVSVSWKGLQGVCLYDKTEKLKHMDYFIPATYEPCTTNTQTKHVVRTAVATTKFPSSPLSPSLPSHPFPAIPTQGCSECSQYRLPIAQLCLEAVLCKHHLVTSTDEQFTVTFLQKKMKIFDVEWTALISAFFQLQPETAIDTFSRTKLNFGRGQNEAACFNFLSAHLTVTA